MSKKLKITCFGEILWDVFPHKQLLGGAPLNVALRLHSLGVKTKMISAVGKDELGDEALEAISKSGLSTKDIHRSKRGTGAVLVTLKNGSATYTFEENSAWDKIKLKEKTLTKIEKQDAVVFGTLALRKKYNRKVLDLLLKESNFSVFDVNFRSPYYSKELVLELLQKSDFVKMNDEELEIIADWLSVNETTIEATIQKLSNKIKANHICVTKGASGAVLLYKGVLYSHPGYLIAVIDTVGAGDSFLATLLFELLQKTKAQIALQKACAMGALVASKEGANCTIDKEEIESLLSHYS